jgi:predicted amidohydrolase
MKQTAAQRNAHIAGSLSIKNHNAHYNRFFCFTPSGNFHHYDKKHLFSYGKEEQHYTAGDKRMTFEIRDWKIMPIVCYDLRFPAWCRNTVDYDILLVVANWPQARIHHWDALLRARAIENQCYVIAVNRTGTDGNNLVYNGHSAVYDMNGMQLLDMESAEDMGQVELHKDELQDFRQRYRFLQDRDALEW